MNALRFAYEKVLRKSLTYCILLDEYVYDLENQIHVGNTGPCAAF